MADTVQSAAVPFTGRKMLFSMLAFFAVIIAANMIMMTFALSTHTGTVVPNSYVASQDFNAHAAKAKAQKARGWSGALAYQDGLAVLSVASRTGGPVSGLRIAGVIGRPVSAEQDQLVKLDERAPGQYVGKVALGPGEWRLDAVAALPTGAEHRMIRTIFIPGRGQ